MHCWCSCHLLPTPQSLTRALKILWSLWDVVCLISILPACLISRMSSCALMSAEAYTISISLSAPSAAFCYNALKRQIYCCFVAFMFLLKDMGLRWVLYKEHLDRKTLVRFSIMFKLSVFLLAATWLWLVRNTVKTIGPCYLYRCPNPSNAATACSKCAPNQVANEGTTGHSYFSGPQKHWHIW